jgi:hypothetical protein
MRAVYGYVWHYTLITDIFRSVVEYHDQRSYVKTNRNNIEKLRNYLKDKNTLAERGFLGTFLTYFGEFTSNRNFNAALKIGDKAGNKDYLNLTDLFDISEQLWSLSQVTKSHQIYLFIDELDTGWDNSREATNFIHGLFYAVRKIKALSGVTAFVSLRSDMYNDLSSILPDPEKMRGEIERFTWNPDMLRELIAERIITNYPMMRQDTPSADAISTVFEDGVLDYIINHSLQRPREVIQFCKDVIGKFNIMVHYGTRTDKVTLDLVKSVEPEFSKFRLEDTCREYQHQYPELHIFLSYFANAKKTYTMSEFKEKLEEAMLRSLDLLGEHSWLGLNFSTIKLVDILFEIGFIKLYSERSKKFLAYYEGSFLNKENVTSVRIHEVFVSALQCY